MLDYETRHMITELPDPVLSHLGRNHPGRLSKRWQNKLFDAELLYLDGTGKLAITREAAFYIAEAFQKRFMTTDPRGQRKISRGRPGGWASG
jgi:hypothetical protein